MKKSTLQQILNGAATVAHRRAFKKMLPFAISNNGKVFLIYPDHRKVEVTSDHLDLLPVNNS